VDDSLSSCPDIYLEAGDHEDFVHLKGVSFRRLMRRAHHGHIC
jgi:Ala-tRNA(Pro) deacylase